MQCISTFIFLLWNTITDFRKREISFLSVFVYVVLGIVIQINNGGIARMVLPVALLPGCCFMIVGMFLKRGIGVGDGILLLVLGMVRGTEWIYKTLFWTFLLSGIYALYLLVVRKKSGKTEFPWVPFLFLGAIVWEVELWIG